MIAATFSPVSSLAADGLLSGERAAASEHGPATQTYFLSSQSQRPGLVMSVLIPRQMMKPGWVEPVAWRVLEILDLQENWDSYGARPVEHDSAARVLDTLAVTMPEDGPPPSLVPTAQGGIQVEWHINGIDLEVEFEPDSQVMDLWFRDIALGEERELTLGQTELHELRTYIEVITARRTPRSNASL